MCWTFVNEKDLFWETDPSESVDLFVEDTTNAANDEILRKYDNEIWFYFYFFNKWKCSFDGSPNEKCIICRILNSYTLM